MKRYLMVLLLWTTLFACVEPFEPEVGDYQQTLVVDGLLTDRDSIAEVILTYSLGYNETLINYVRNAQVVIESNDGNQVQLEEGNPGIYRIHSSTFKAEVGKEYRLVIQVNEDRFESDWQLLKAAPEIDEIRFEADSRIPDDPDLDPIRGVQFYVNTKDENGETIFYQWEWEETYIYVNPSPQQQRVVFSGDSRNRTAEFFEIPFKETEGSQCWQTNSSSEILIASTENLTQDQIVDFPLLFVDNTTPRLYLRYSLLVKQYAISKEYYRFLARVEEVNETSGSLFDPIPNEIFGNVKSVTDNNIPVLGYFAVAGVSEKRIFVEREDLQTPLGAPRGPRCIEDTVAVGQFDILYQKALAPRRIFHNFLFSPSSPGIIGYLVTDSLCAFCNVSGATNIQPDFW